MNKTFKTIEEAADAMKNAMWVSNGDPALLEDRTFAEEIAHDFMGYTNGMMRELLPNENAWGIGNDFEDAKERLGLKDNVVRHIYVWSEDGMTNYIAFAEDWDYAEEEGNEIFKALVDETIRENEQQAGKIVGKILAEAKENEKAKETNEAGIPSGRYFRYTYYAGRLTMSFIEYHPTGEEIWDEKPYATNAFGMGIKKYDVYARKGAKKPFTIFLAETPEQVRFMSR